MGEIDAVDNEPSETDVDDPGTGNAPGDDVDVVSDTNPNATPEEVDEATAAAAGVSPVAAGYAAATKKNPGMMMLSSVMPGMGILSFAAALANAPHGSLAGDGTSDPDPGGEAGAIGGDDTADVAAAAKAAAAKQAAADEAAADKAAADKIAGDKATQAADVEAAGVKDDFDTKAASAAKRARRRGLAASTTSQSTIATSPRGILGAPSSIVRKRLLGA
jgi:colicin import membrane protein